MMKQNPQRDVSSPYLRAEAAGLIPSVSLAAALPFSENLPYEITHFFETLGIADDIPWRPTHDQDEPPF